MKITNSLLTEIALVGVGAYKTYSDYNNASKEQKNRTLVRNIATISACALGVMKMDSFLERNVDGKKIQDFIEDFAKSGKNKFVDKIIKRVVKNLKSPELKIKTIANVASEAIKSDLVNITGILTGVGVGKLIDNTIFRAKDNDKTETKPIQDKHVFINPFEKQITLLSSTTPGKIILSDQSKNIFVTTTKMFEAAGFINNPLNKPFMVIDNLELSKEKNMKKVLEQTATGIVLETILPTAFVATSNTIMQNSKWYKKLPVVGTSFLVGTWIADKIGNMMKQEVKVEGKK